MKDVFGYYDHFNDVLYRGDGAKEKADKAIAGGNLITEVYAAPTPPSNADSGVSNRAAFENDLKKNPDARFWNTTDAMYWAWLQGRNTATPPNEDDLVKACELLIQQYDAETEFTMGGALTNEPFLRIRAALANYRARKGE